MCHLEEVAIIVTTCSLGMLQLLINSSMLLHMLLPIKQNSYYPIFSWIFNNLMEHHIA